MHHLLGTIIRCTRSLSIAMTAEAPKTKDNALARGHQLNQEVDGELQLAIVFVAHANHLGELVNNLFCYAGLLEKISETSTNEL